MDRDVNSVGALFYAGSYHVDALFTRRANATRHISNKSMQSGPLMQLLELYTTICDDQNRQIFQVRFACESLLETLIVNLRKQFTVKVFDAVPTIHEVGAGNLFGRTIYVAPYDTRLEKASPGGTLLLVVKKGTRKAIMDVALPPFESIQPLIQERMRSLGLSVDDGTFRYIARIAQNDPANIKAIFSLISTYLVGIGESEITRQLVDRFFPQETNITPFALFNQLVSPSQNGVVFWDEFEKNLQQFGTPLPLIAALTTMALKRYYVILGKELAIPLADIEDVTGLVKLSNVRIDSDLAITCRLLLQLTLCRYEILGRYYDAEIVLRMRLLEYVSKKSQVSPDMLI